MPITPSTINSTYDSSSNTSPLLFNHSASASLHPPFASEWEPEYWDSRFGSDTKTIPDLPIPLIPLKCVSNAMQGSEMDLSEGAIPHQHWPKLQCQISLLMILCNLQGLKCTIINLLMAVIDGSGDFKQFFTALFTPKNHSSLVGLLETLVQDMKCCPIVTTWMFPHVLGLVCEKVQNEMEAACYVSMARSARRELDRVYG
jgi:hypothetical protein